MKTRRPIRFFLLRILLLILANLLTDVSAFAQGSDSNVYLPTVLQQSNSSGPGAEVTITVDDSIQPLRPELPGLV